MKTIYKQLKLNNKNQVTFNKDIIFTYAVNNILDEYSMDVNLAAVKRHLDVSTKKYIKEAYASQVTIDNDTLANIELHCKDDSGWKYKKTITFLLDTYSNRIIQL